MSKGVVLSHRNFIGAICMFNSGHDENLLPTDIYLVVLPQFHVYGLAICTVAALARGITVVILPQFDLVKMLSAIQTYKVTTVPLVPPIIIALTKLDIVNKFDLSSLLQLGSGAAPLGKEMMSACAKRFPNIRLKQVLRTPFWYLGL
jgi:4-coumarate--CoA ligase